MLMHLSRQDPPVECIDENQSQFQSTHHSQASIEERTSQPQYSGTHQLYAPSYPNISENRHFYSFAGNTINCPS